MWQWYKQGGGGGGGSGVGDGGGAGGLAVGVIVRTGTIVATYLVFYSRFKLNYLY